MCTLEFQVARTKPVAYTRADLTDSSTTKNVLRLKPRTKDGKLENG